MLSFSLLSLQSDVWLTPHLLQAVVFCFGGQDRDGVGHGGGRASKEAERAHFIRQQLLPVEEGQPARERI
jgi:hypothetical protein